MSVVSTWSIRRLGMASVIVALSIVVAAPAVSAAPKTKLVSKKTGGAQADDASRLACASANGRFVVFRSDATNLVNNDNNDDTDIFVHDRKTKKTKRVSVSSQGVEGDSTSYDPAISANGRYVVFASGADNLVNGDTGKAHDIFLHDRKTKKTRRVSVRSNGKEANSSSFEPSISANGRIVAYTSNASNLVNGDTNNRADVFTYDRITRKTRRVSIKSNGKQGDESSGRAAVSADGRFIAFISDAKKLVKNDTNARSDAFVHDRKAGKTSRVSRSSSGAQANDGTGEVVISGSGRYVAFESKATNLAGTDANGTQTDIFVHDRKTKKTKLASKSSGGTQGDQASGDPSISANGRWVAFESQAENLVGGDTNSKIDIFVHDRKNKKTRRVSVPSGGGQAQDSSGFPSISGDGRFVAFESNAPNLVGTDANGTTDIFLRGPLR